MSDTTTTLPTKIFAIPTFLQSALHNSRPVQATLSDVWDSDIESTSSYLYETRGSAIKSTQQLNIDWSKFENHCFFMSAEALVNIAFDQIINGYPFDGTQQEIESYFSKLSGFEKWCFDQFPKYKGALKFDGTSYISVIDKVGALFPEVSSNVTGKNVLNPGVGSFSIETHLFVPGIAYTSNKKQVLCQKYNSITNNGFTLYLNFIESSTPGSYDTPELTFSVISGSYFTNVSSVIECNQYNHIVATLDRSRDNSTIVLFNNCEQVAIGKYRPYIGNLFIDNENFTIGTGSSWSEYSTAIVPNSLFTGSLDEFRFFHNVRTIKQQQEYHQKSLTANDDLKLYFKFNEPQSPLVSDPTSAINAIVIDSSGNNLHSLITNFTGTLRINNANDISNILIYEKDELSPVLFPAYNAVTILNANLLISASLYDNENPNIITKLIPEHWILQGQSYEGFDDQFGNIHNAYGSTGDNIPGQGQLGSTHLILSFLYMYARFFDEVKITIDQFANVNHVSFDEYETTPNTFLYELMKSCGLDLPPIFNDASIAQYIHSENIDNTFSVSETSLRSVQDQLMKRVLIHLPKIIQSKGTLYSIQAFLRSIGIDPQNSVRIREYGGPTKGQLNFVREQKNEPSLMLKMNTGSLIWSPFLSASRVEVGTPVPIGPFVLKNIFTPHGISTNKNDGLLTSGSWSIEAIYKWPTQKLVSTVAGFHTTQSLCRLCTTGTISSRPLLLANLIALSGSNGTNLNFYFSPGSDVNNIIHCLTLELGLTQSIFDSTRWNICFGVERLTANSSQLFIKAGNQSYGEIEHYFTTSSFFTELSSTLGGLTGSNLLQTLDSSKNASGTFIQCGQSTTFLSSSVGLNKTTIDNIVRDTHFVGQISNLRFWSRTLTDIDFQEHIRNYKSAGVENPLLNYGFNHTSTGSFERLRLDTIFQQEIREPYLTASIGLPTGSIILIDHSQNNFHLTGSGFPLHENCLIGELFDHSYLSPYYDESVTTEKIRIRSAQTQELVSKYNWTDWAPVYEVPLYERNTDDLRFSIEFSLIDALNRDIVTLFSTYEALNNAIGSPELMFSYNYPDMDRLREIYFNRIKEKIDFKSFFEFFQWFDVSIGTFIQQLLPRKTNFQGTNFVVESHMLERHKNQYHFENMYLNADTRPQITDTLLVQQIAGTIRKF